MGLTGESLAPLVVRVTDGSGMPVEGTTVFWDVLSGGGELTPMGNVSGGGDADAATVTSSTGLTEIMLTLGPQAGVNEVKAESIFSNNQSRLAASVIFVATGTSP